MVWRGSAWYGTVRYGVGLNCYGLDWIGLRRMGWDGVEVTRGGMKGWELDAWDGVRHDRTAQMAYQMCRRNHNAIELDPGGVGAPPPPT